MPASIVLRSASASAASATSSATTAPAPAAGPGHLLAPLDFQRAARMRCSDDDDDMDSACPDSAGPLDGSPGAVLVPRVACSAGGDSDMALVDDSNDAAVDDSSDADADAACAPSRQHGCARLIAHPFDKTAHPCSPAADAQLDSDGECFDDGGYDCAPDVLESLAAPAFAAPLSSAQYRSSRTLSADSCAWPSPLSSMLSCPPSPSLSTLSLFWPHSSSQSSSSGVLPQRPAPAALVSPPLLATDPSHPGFDSLCALDPGHIRSPQMRTRYLADHISTVPLPRLAEVLCLLGPVMAAEMQHALISGCDAEVDVRDLDDGTWRSLCCVLGQLSV
nr:hypothetical protein HK105_003497 [Polyrhizophydium stewartii]